MRGDTRRSESLLESAISASTGRDRQTAALHAYLGVAYAAEALRSGKDNDASAELRQKALSEFRLARAAERDYRLSTRIVSPKILALFDQVR
jgi:hypothetical protein